MGPKRSSLSTRKALLVRCVVVTLVVFAAAQVWTNLNEFVQPTYFYVAPDLYSKACKAPQVDPWDPLVLPYYKKLPPLSCKRLQPELTYVDSSGRLLVNWTEMKEAGLDNLKCQYRCIEHNGITGDLGDNFSEWTALPEAGETLRCEFVETTCQKGILPVSFYTNFHNHVIRVPQAKLSDEAQRQPIGVLLFVIDSMSRSNFVRCMPKLFDVLSTEYRSTMFRGFNKVGDNSFPNGVAMLTGKRMAEVEELPADMRGRFYDDWPIVWKRFAEKGYATLFAEDMPNWSLFNQDGNGFRTKPTDHYYRPLMSRMFYSFLHLRSKHLCIGNNPTHRHQLNYVKQFLRQYSGRRPVFGLNWQTEISHDWINQAQLADEDFARFFSEIRPYASNTVLFVLSDHGQRFGSIRHTVVGRIEENTPVFIVALPKQAANRHPKLVVTLQRNAQLLATHYDLHATLLHLLDHPNWEALERAATDNLYGGATPLPRGLSLFRPLPKDRSCRQADIPEEYCTCGRQVAVDSKTEMARRSAQAVVRHLNAQLEQLEPGRCALLKVARVLSAYALLPGIEVKSSFWNPPRTSAADYLVTVEATPGGGHFEAVLRQSAGDGRPSIVGQISRINRYGNKSRCASSAEMRKFCYCLETPTPVA
uniref:Sulfatase N-terminal domain-containing protein n=1 Tax=Trichuris muris TaxID=70415 RepID=A0A5S6R4L0_TRIMR